MRKIDLSSNTRTCTKCKKTKELAAFHERSDQPGHYRSACKACVKTYQAARYLRTKDRHRIASRRYSLRHLYGLSYEEYIRQCFLRENSCEICGQKANLVVDHDHKTGKLRGYICKACNTGLGLFKDDLENLQMAVAYLKDSIEHL